MPKTCGVSFCSAASQSRIGRVNPVFRRVRIAAGSGVHHYRGDALLVPVVLLMRRLPWAAQLPLVAVCGVLRQLGVLDATALADLEEFASPPIRDPRGERAGQVTAVLRIA